MAPEPGQLQLQGVADGRRFWLVERTFPDGSRQYHVRRASNRIRIRRGRRSFRERVARLPLFGELEWKTTIEMGKGKEKGK